jgi:hypothetical protein
MKDVKKLLMGFETIGDYMNRDKVITTLKEIFLEQPNVYDDTFL